MAEFTAQQRAFIRHAISDNLETMQQTDTDSTGRRARPGMNNKQIADALGVHVNSIGNWLKKPEIAEAIRKGTEEARSSKDYFRLVMRQRALEELWVQYEKATGSDKRQYLALILKETEDVDESDAEAVPVGDMTVEDLCAVILGTEVSAAGMTSAQLRAKMRGNHGTPVPDSGGGPVGAGAVDGMDGEGPHRRRTQ